MKIPKPSPSVKAFLTGMGSIIDLRGEETYRRMQELTPSAPRRTFQEVSAETALQFRQSFRSN